jgi:hypothetical protein
MKIEVQITLSPRDDEGYFGPQAQPFYCQVGRTFDEADPRCVVDREGVGRPLVGDPLFAELQALQSAIDQTPDPSGVMPRKHRCDRSDDLASRQPAVGFRSQHAEGQRLIRELREIPIRTGIGQLKLDVEETLPHLRGSVDPWQEPRWTSDIQFHVFVAPVPPELIRRVLR